MSRGNAVSKKKIGLRIRRLRRSKNQSQQALAAAVGRHVNTLARWESTGIDPRHGAIPLIAAALQCPQERLTGEPETADDAYGEWFAQTQETIAAYLIRFPKSWRGARTDRSRSPAPEPETQ